MRLELRRMWRSPSFLIYTVLLPLAFYLLITNVAALAGQAKQVAGTYAMISIGAYSTIGALLNYGATLGNDRAMGWLRQLRLTPIAPNAVVYGKALTGMVLALPPVIVLCLAAMIINDIRLAAGQWLAIVLLLWLCSAPFSLLGIALGYAARTQSAQAINFLVYFGMAAIGGLWFPLQAFPPWLQGVGRLTPAHAYADLSWRVAAIGENTLARDLVVLGAWFGLFWMFAAYAYRRSAARLSS
jgi:ABC-2 type transport system permease protein